MQRHMQVIQHLKSSTYVLFNLCMLKAELYSLGGGVGMGGQ